MTGGATATGEEGDGDRDVERPDTNRTARIRVDHQIRELT
jgi:hypothetical protein